MKWTKEQSRAINENGTDLLVSAGAGCGKTAILTNRIVRLMLDERVDIDRFMIATFTNAAASSMKEKIRKLLYEKLSGELTEKDRQFLFRQISRIESASISTIHSFCIRIIREYYHVIGVDPSFRIIDETNAKLLMEEALDTLFERRYLENDQDFINTSLAYSFEKGEAEFREILIKIYDFIYNRPDPFGWLNEKTEIFTSEASFEESVQFGYLKVHILNALDLAVTMAQDTYEEALKAGVVKKSIENLENDLENLRILRKKAEKDVFSLAEVNLRDVYSGNLTPAHFADTAQKDSFKAMRDQSRDLVKNTAGILAFSKDDTAEIIKRLSVNVTSIAGALKELDEIFADLKEENGVLEFRDLEHLALRILNNETAREEILSTYRYVFVDEYQDTNLVQEAIINNIISGNNLFTVGDVKQSIYRFRQADPDIFIDRLKGYEAYTIPGNVIHMNTNFRTNPNVIRGINYIFKNLMSEAVGKIDYTSDEELIPGREENGKNKTEFHLVIGNTADEIEYVGKLINDLIDEDIYDPELGRMRKIRYSDICILARSANTKIADFKSVFNRYSIPINSEIESGYFKTVEIEMMKSLLSIINNSSDDINLIAAMRSPVFGFTPDELLEIRMEGKGRTYSDAADDFIKRSENETLKEKLIQMKAFIEEYRQKSRYLGISELISDIYRKTGLVEYIKALPFGNIRANNLKSLIQKANEYEGFSNNGLYGFIHFLDYSREKNEAGAGSSMGEDSVNYMSIHKSKGLEFPVVILYGCAKSFNLKDTEKPFVLNKKVGISPTLIDIENGFTADSFLKTLAAAYEKDETISEEMRLLYVALTRAKERLIMTGNYHYNPLYLDKLSDIRSKYDVQSAGNYMKWVTQSIMTGRRALLKDSPVRYEDDLFLIKQVQAPIDVPEKREVKPEEGKKKYTLTEEEKREVDSRLSFRYQNEIDTRIPRNIGVSSLKHIDLIEVGKRVISYRSTPSFALGKSEMNAAQKGTLIHYLLEMMNLDKLRNASSVKEEVSSQIDLLVKKGSVTKEELSQIDESVIAEFFESGTGKGLLASERIYREKTFSLEVEAKTLRDEWKDSLERVLIKGVIDLMYEDENGDLVIIDYKTSRYKNEEEKKALLDEYSIQLGYYRKAVETLMNRKVSGTLIYFLLYNEVCEV